MAVSYTHLRQDAVEELNMNYISREEICEYLNPVYDLERLIGRISYKTANPRDLLAFKTSLEMLPYIDVYKRQGYNLQFAWSSGLIAGRCAAGGAGKQEMKTEPEKWEKNSWGKEIRKRGTLGKRV